MLWVLHKCIKKIVSALFDKSVEFQDQKLEDIVV